MSNALLLGGAMLINYLVVSVNMRAVSYERYTWIAATDFVICVLNFSIIKRVSAAESLADRICYALGGTAGALLGVWLSRAWGA